MKPATDIERQRRMCQRVIDDALPAVREAARALGYAVAVHGSLARDVDLVAIAWTEDAQPPRVLVDALRDALERCLDYARIEEPDDWHRDGMAGHKPHARLVWTIHVPGTHVDLSVIAPPEHLPRCTWCGVDPTAEESA